MPYSSRCQPVSLRGQWRGVPQGGELPTLTAGLLGRILGAEWLGPDTSPDSLSLFIKSTKYTAKEDKIGQIKCSRRIIQGYNGQSTNPKRQRLERVRKKSFAAL